jgi:hypothetical protein
VIDEGSEFQVLAALLKSWGLPFEILRLDQQRLDKYHLLDRDGRPRYGTIIWDAGHGEGLDVLRELVKQHGVSLVVLGDTAAAPEISALAGVRYISDRHGNIHQPRNRRPGAKEPRRRDQALAGIRASPHSG